MTRTLGLTSPIDWIFFVALVAGGLVVIVKAMREESRDLWRDEVDALTKKIDRLEKELGESRRENVHLEGRVHELSRENEQMRALLMGEKVPKALEDALTGITRRIVKRIDESEDRTAEGILHMTDAIAKVMRDFRSSGGRGRAPGASAD